jgi:hypothetical protein
MLHHLGDLAVYRKYWPRLWNEENMKFFEQTLDELVPSEPISSTGLLASLIDTDSSGESRVFRQVFDSASGLRWDHRCLLKEEWISQGKLEIVYDRVKKLSIVDGTVSSILLSARGELAVSQADEVVLCAGTFGTPRILWNSGIKSVHGNSISGKRVDIGDNLQDHSLIGTMFLGPWPGSWNILETKKSSREPANCVHGFIYLDNDGSLFQNRSEEEIAR